MPRSRKVRARGVPARERAQPVEIPGLHNWETARAFLEVARSGSFRAASQSLHLSVNTLRRHIDEFEREVGLTLLTRHVDGVRLTAEGEMLVGAAKRMELASFDIARLRNLKVSLRGEVRLSVTEGLGTFWLAPRLVEFQRAYPGLLVDMMCAMRPADVLRLETDVGIQITRPTDKDLRIVKLGRMHTMPFASHSYVEVHGRPKCLADMSKHRIVLQVSDQLPSVEQLDQLFPALMSQVFFRTNVSSAHFWAVARGAGIGVLPTYAAAIGGRIEPIDLAEIRFAFDIWLAYHPDAAKIPRVRCLIDWLIEAFSPKRFPWFGDEFVHPRDLPQNVAGLSLSSLYEGVETVR